MTKTRASNAELVSQARVCDTGQRYVGKVNYISQQIGIHFKMVARSP